MDPADQPMMWRLTDHPHGRVTYEIVTEKASYALNMSADQWDRFKFDVYEAHERGESIEPVLQLWATMLATPI